MTIIPTTPHSHGSSWRLVTLAAYLIVIVIVLCHHIPHSAAQSPNASPDAPASPTPVAASASPVPQVSPSPAPPSPAPSNSRAPAASPSSQPSQASSPRATSSPGATPTASSSRVPTRTPATTGVVAPMRPSDDSGLSDSAKIGLGVGLGVGVPVLLLALAVTATVAGLLLHRRFNSSGGGGGNSTKPGARPAAAVASAPAVAQIEPVGAVLYRSRIPAPSASSADTMDIVEQADVEGHHNATGGGGQALNSGDLQTSISTTSFSSASSVGSWRRNNNVDLFVTEEPV